MQVPTTTIGNPVIFNTVELSDSSTLTHAQKSDPNVAINWIAQSFNVDGTSKIDLTEKGLLPNAATGSTFGGSYGGIGGNSDLPAFGEALKPFNQGIGGGSSSYKSRGAGALKLNAVSLNLDGSIISNGQAAQHSYYGAGSGGSVWITAGDVSGEGSIVANGGISSNGGGGSGGRIAVYYATSTGSLINNIAANGGSNLGENGTVYTEQRDLAVFIKRSTPTSGELLFSSINYIDIEFLAAIDEASFTIDDVTLAGEETLSISSIDKLTDTSYRIHLDKLITVNGDYNLSVGPNISSASGHLMDQNINGTEGEIDDAYQVNFEFKLPESLVTEDITITEQSNPFEGKDVIVNGVTLTASGTINIASLELSGIADLTVPLLDNGEAASLTLNVDELIIGENAQINLSGKGLTSNTLAASAGGSHGGYGGLSWQVEYTETAQPFGMQTSPQSAGIGGSDAFSQSNSISRGGAAIKINAKNIIVNGAINSNGSSIVGQEIGAGAGGSIWINTESLSGSGYISAKGGDSQLAGNGSGGRVAIYYQSLDAFDIKTQVTASGGGTSLLPVTNEYGQLGAAGSVYLFDSLTENSQLHISNDFYDASMALTPVNSNETELNLTNVNVEFGNVYTTNIISTDSMINTPLSATVHTSQLDAQRTIFTNSIAWDISDNHFELTSGNKMVLNNNTIWEYLTLRDSSVLTTKDYSEGDLQLSLTANVLAIDEGAAINLDGKGKLSSSEQIKFGGSHGGLGGFVPNVGVSAQPTVGSMYSPTTYGGGGIGKSDGYKLSGGGALYIETSEIELNGLISANGADTSQLSQASYYAGSAGGSIWVNTNSLSGTGTITANGTEGYSNGSGAGGRIAVYYQINDGFDTTKLSTAGKSNSTENLSGGNGTVYTANNAIAPKIIEPTGQYVKPAEKIRVTYSTYVDFESISVADVNLTLNSEAVVINEITWISPTEFEINLDQVMKQGEYLLSIQPNAISLQGLGIDQNQDGQIAQADDVFEILLNVDSEAPSALTITSHDVNALPNYSASTIITLQGTNESDANVYINGQQVSQLTANTWELALTKSSGENYFELYQVDPAGNRSETITLSVFIDASSPSLYNVIPTGYLASSPITVQFVAWEGTNGSGINENATLVTVLNTTTEVEYSGDLDFSTANIVKLHLSDSLAEGDYTVSAQVSDRAGNTGVVSYTFNIDTTAPSAPTMDISDFDTVQEKITLSGVAELDTRILINGSAVTSWLTQAQWSHEVTLTEGGNILSITSIDRAGNISDAATVLAQYDNTAPDQVSLIANVNGTGQNVFLDWNAYDEQLNGGDIVEYRVYQHNSNFIKITDDGVQLIHTQSNKQYEVTGLTRNQIYYFSVVAVDRHGLSKDAVNAILVLPVDVVAPANPQLSIHSVIENQVTINVIKPSDSDFNSVALSLNGQQQVINTFDESGIAQSQFTGLPNNEKYTAQAIAYDQSNNASTATSLDVYALIDNPQITETTSHSGRISMQWDAMAPTSHTQSYLLYVSDTAFTSISGLTASVTLPGSITSGGIAGMNNGQTYYVAVAARNQSNALNNQVASVEVTPEEDVEGPVLSALKFNGQEISNAQTLTESGVISVNVSDKSGLGSVSLLLDNIILDTQYGIQNQYTYNLDLTTVTDGDHIFTVQAGDTYSNTSTQGVSVSVQLSAPSAPSLLGSDTLTGQSEYTIEGTSENGTLVSLYKNTELIAESIEIENGQFSYNTTIETGDNTFIATAIYEGRTANSDESNERVVTLDDTIPTAPEALVVVSKAAGRIALSWSTVADEGVVGYNLYRSLNIFTNAENATLVNTELLTKASFEDIPAEDGRYYYAVVAVNQLDTQSDLSPLQQGTVDKTGPVVNVTYQTDGPYDVDTNTFGQGRMELEIQFSETLRNEPYFALTPEGGVPKVLSLNKSFTKDNTYTTSLSLDNTLQVAKYWAVVGAYDELNNRTGSVTEGRFIFIDTQGPKVQAASFDPVSPIKNETTGKDVTFTFTLDEAITDTEPVLVTPGTRDDQFNFQAFTEFESGLTALPLGNNQWAVTFTLPADLGVSDSGVENTESLYLSVQAQDALANTRIELLEQYRADVYQGDLPALSSPFGFNGLALAQGKVKLTWQTVGNANSYAIYRKALAETEFTQIAVVTMTAGTEVNEYIDGQTESLSETSYSYYMTSMREHNDQQSESTASNIVQVTVDASAPTAPTNLVLTLASNGVLAEWQEPQGEDSNELYYSLYRLPNDWDEQTADLTSVAPALSPIRGEAILDSKPSSDSAKYAVTATDQTGNESAPSTVVYLNVDLLPVTEVKLTESATGQVTLSWKGITGTPVTYAVDQIISGQTNTLATELADTSLIDSAITLERNQDIDYSVVAKDSSNAESLAHLITLPSISIAKADPDAVLKRGIMNRLELRVDNQGSLDISNATLDFTLDINGENKAHTSESFGVKAGSFSIVPIVIGGYEGLEILEQANVKFVWSPAQGDTVKIDRELTIQVEDDTLLFNLLIENAVAGSEAKITLKANNHTDTELDFVVAENKGKDASSQVRIKLYDTNDDLISITPVQIALGNVINLASGETVIRMPANSEYISPEILVQIPSAAPEDIKVVMEIDKFHYHLGQASHVEMGGITLRTTATTKQTDYSVSISSQSHTSIIAGEKFTVSGTTQDRATDLPKPNANIKLVYSLNGFEQIKNTTTNESGEFTYEFASTEGVSGIYYISATHPEVTERPIMAQVIAQVLKVSPTKASIRTPYNYQTQMPLKITASKQWQEKTISVALSSETPLQQGIVLTLPDERLLKAGQVYASNVQLSATTEAPSSGYLLLEVKDKDADRLLSYVRINYEFSEAAGHLKFNKPYVQTGVAQSESTTEQFTIENTGFADIPSLTTRIENTDTTPAPSWLSMISGSTIESLAIGESQAMEIQVNPDDSIAEGQYQYNLIVESTAAGLQQTLPIYVSISQSGIGNIYFHVADIYTATLDADGNAIPGLSGAKLKLQNELVYSEVYEGTSNEFGDVSIDDIPAGRYIYRVSAFDHETVSGRVWIKPDSTTSENAFLMNKLISVSFEVKEITIEDKYEIVLNATFETAVPAAVVTIEPMMINMPMMKQGEVYQGELTISNHGLINADSMKDNLPRGDAYARFEYQRELPETLAAGQVFIMPYRIVALKNFENDSDLLESGGCAARDYNGGVSCTFDCVNGFQGDCGASMGANANSGGDSCGDGDGGGDWNFSGGGDGGSSAFTDAPRSGAVTELGDGYYKCVENELDDSDPESDCG